MGPAAAVIALQLSSHAEQLVREFYPDAKLHGSELRWHGRDGAVWSMVVRGLKRGVWCNWGETKQCGDALELVHYTLFLNETGRRESIAWSARWLGIDESSPLDPARALELRRIAMQAMQRRALEQQEFEQAKRRQVLGMYLDNRRSVPVPLTPELASYLQHRLATPIERLSGVPRSLRFTPSFGYDRNLTLPAMLAPVLNMEGQHVATHVTYLHEGDDGVFRKARVDPAKKVFGAYKRGIIPLLKGASNKPWTRAVDGERILIAEGIENALAASLTRDDEPRVVACVAAGNLPALELPAAFTHVILAYDRDGENESIRRSREEAETKFKSQHRSIEKIKPPKGVKDFADYLVMEGGVTA